MTLIALAWAFETFVPANMQPLFRPGVIQGRGFAQAPSILHLVLRVLGLTISMLTISFFFFLAGLFHNRFALGTLPFSIKVWQYNGHWSSMDHLVFRFRHLGLCA